jgi:transcriptional regulator with XRE-family HTH domain
MKAARGTDAEVVASARRPLLRRNVRRAATYEYFGGTVKQATVKKTPNPVDKHVGSQVRMRRMMLGMSQAKLGDALGLTFQQVQKYESGKNRMGASRLQHISHILQAPVPFFFEGAPEQTKGKGNAPSPAYVSEFMATTEGVALIKALMRIKPRLRRCIVGLVEEIAGAGDDFS